jgi:glycosyltransferase involved in cell wall biosynthesis
VFPVLANSYNRTGLRARLEVRRIVSLLNDDRFPLVANHCRPATEHLAALGVRREKLLAWDMPHPFTPFDVEPRTGLRATPPQGFFVGTISEDKGVGDIVRAIAVLRDRGIQVGCSLAGTGDIDAMSALAERLGVRDRLAFIGRIGNADVMAHMRAADLVFVPSRREYPEGFPLTMFEAIASRTPIVCSDHPVFAPVITDGRNASVFTTGDERSLAAAIERTISDPALYARLSEQAGATWRALEGPMDWRTMVRTWALEGPDAPALQGRTLAGT